MCVRLQLKLIAEIFAGQLTGIAEIGSGDKPDEADALTHAGATAVTTRLGETARHCASTRRCDPTADPQRISAN
jgi:hypothetical protein